MHSGIAPLGVTALLNLLILLRVRAGSSGLVDRSGCLLCLRGKRNQGSNWQDRKPRSRSHLYINRKIFSNHIAIARG
ncbi:hypothetical protein DO71_4778 [Burkholderia pseudomallei]|nr:hypothetical protein DO71_4778 [Burkholderia pseudomallei]KGX51828.1 hypothetical protein Y027_5115 [Burkholderia pseudomallei TSV5]